jgi:hypothetical protein
MCGQAFVLASLAMIACWSFSLCRAALKKTRNDAATFAFVPALKLWAILNPIE